MLRQLTRPAPRFGTVREEDYLVPAAPAPSSSPQAAGTRPPAMAAASQPQPQPSPPQALPRQQLPGPVLRGSFVADTRGVLLLLTRPRHYEGPLETEWVRAAVAGQSSFNQVLNINGGVPPQPTFENTVPCPQYWDGPPADWAGRARRPPRAQAHPLPVAADARPHRACALQVSASVWCDFLRATLDGSDAVHDARFLRLTGDRTLDPVVAVTAALRRLVALPTALVHDVGAYANVRPLCDPAACGAGLVFGLLEPLLLIASGLLFVLAHALITVPWLAAGGAYLLALRCCSSASVLRDAKAARDAAYLRDRRALFDSWAARLNAELRPEAVSFTEVQYHYDSESGTYRRATQPLASLVQPLRRFARQAPRCAGAVRRARRRSRCGRCALRCTPRSRRRRRRRQHMRGRSCRRRRGTGTTRQRSRRRCLPRRRRGRLRVTGSRIRRATGRHTTTTRSPAFRSGSGRGASEGAGCGSGTLDSAAAAAAAARALHCDPHLPRPRGDHSKAPHERKNKPSAAWTCCTASWTPSRGGTRSRRGRLTSAWRPSPLPLRASPRRHVRRHPSLLEPRSFCVAHAGPHGPARVRTRGAKVCAHSL